MFNMLIALSILFFVAIALLTIHFSKENKTYKDE